MSEYAPGVHIADDEDIDLVVEALHDRLDANPGDTVYFRAGRLKREHDINLPGQKVTAALRDLADEEHDDIEVERWNPNSNKARWTARRADGEHALIADGGEILDEPPSEYFVLEIDGDHSWHTDGFGEEYDAIHAAAGALLAGADSVTVRREGCDGS